MYNPTNDILVYVAIKNEEKHKNKINKMYVYNIIIVW